MIDGVACEAEALCVGVLLHALTMLRQGAVVPLPTYTALLARCLRLERETADARAEAQAWRALAYRRRRRGRAVQCAD